MDRAKAARELALIKQYIEADPRRAGEDEARLARSGVSVWALIAYLRAVGHDFDRVASDYEIPVAAVEAAWAYYNRHKRAVDARIAANDTA